MARRLVLIMWSLSLFGCGKIEKPLLIREGDHEIAVQEVKGDVPHFERVYTAKLDNRASLQIKARTAYGNRYLRGELDQPDGRWVLFDPDAIADKILDPLLVPIVQSYVDSIKQADKAYIDSKPAMYIDEDGTVWRRD